MSMYTRNEVGIGHGTEGVGDGATREASGRSGDAWVAVARGFGGYGRTEEGTIGDGLGIGEMLDIR
jgi:hypothetical protein